MCLDGPKVSASGGLLTSGRASAACAEANCLCVITAIHCTATLSVIYALQKKSRIINIERDFCIIGVS